MKIAAVINRFGETCISGGALLLCEEYTRKWAPALYARACARRRPLPVTVEISKRRMPGAHAVSVYRYCKQITWGSGHGSGCHTTLPIALLLRLRLSRIRIPNHDTTRGWIRITSVKQTNNQRKET